MGVNIMDSTMNERLKNVTINWSYPKLLDNLWHDERLSGIGIYYISRKFGTKETLLYIGMTSDSFYARLEDHDYKWLRTVRGKKYVRLGTIVYPTNKSDNEMRNLIKDVESALIYDNRTTLEKYQIMNIRTYTPKHWYLISNEGFRGALCATVSMNDHV